MKAILLIASLSLCLCTALGQNAGTIAHENEYVEIIAEQIHQDDADAVADQKYEALPPEVIPLMVRMLHAKSISREKDIPSSTWPFHVRCCLVGMLAHKLEQYRAVVPPATRQSVIDVIVDQLGQEERENLREMLSNVERLKDPKIDQFLMNLKQSNDPETQKMASFFIAERAKQPSPTDLR